VLKTIKSHVKNCKLSNLLILEIVLHVTWNCAFSDAEYLRDYCRPYTTKCNAHARSNFIGVTLVSWINLFTEQRMLTEINCGNGSKKVQFRVRTTVISQIFSVNESAVPCDMQNYFEFQQVWYLQFLTCDLIVLNTMFKLISFLH
jgi:hypothetical protein